jgi:HEPN domain-containing protein
MDLKEKQAEKYIEEAKLSIEVAKSIFNAGKEKTWAHVIKNCYDAIEQAISAALAKKDIRIPKEHPAKITEFINSYSPDEKITKILFYWLRKRSSSQYVDIKDGKVIVPHEIFTKEDAKKALEDCEKIIDFIKNLIKNK